MFFDSTNLKSFLPALAASTVLVSFPGACFAVKTATIKSVDGAHSKSAHTKRAIKTKLPHTSNVPAPKEDSFSAKERGFPLDPHSSMPHTVMVPGAVLYQQAWALVKDSYFDLKFGGQDWSSWQHRFDNKLNSPEEAQKAIRVMFDSLKPYQPRLIEKDQVEKHLKSSTEPRIKSRSNLASGVAYLKIDTYESGSIFDEFKATLDKLGKTEALILDLRGCRGGSMGSTLNIADSLLDSGIIVSTVYADGYKKSIKATGGTISKLPMVVLIDSGTENEAELLASSLHENKRATLIGTPTKGILTLVRTTQHLGDGSVVSIPIARWLTASDGSIEESGVIPDTEVTPTPQDLNEGKGPWWKNGGTLEELRKTKDMQLKAAIDFLQKQRKRK